MSRPPTPVIDRVLPRLQRGAPGGCWLWTGALSRGYGVVGVPGRKLAKVHRVVYEHFIGLIPDAMTLDHTCHTADESCPGGDSCPHRRCANPEHLEVVTLAENKARGRSPVAENARKEACPKCGTPYENDGPGKRRCRPCRNEWRRGWQPANQKRPEVHAQRMAAQRARRAKAREADAA